MNKGEAAAEDCLLVCCRAVMEAHLATHGRTCPCKFIPKGEPSIMGSRVTRIRCQPFPPFQTCPNGVEPSRAWIKPQHKSLRPEFVVPMHAEIYNQSWKLLNFIIDNYFISPTWHQSTHVTTLLLPEV